MWVPPPQVGMLPWTYIHESAAIVPYRIPLPFGRHISFLNPGFFQALNDRDVAVVVYGDKLRFNSESVYRSARQAGANAICTDAPSLLRRLLDAEGPLKPLPWQIR